MFLEITWLQELSPIKSNQGELLNPLMTEKPVERSGQRVLCAVLIPQIKKDITLSVCQE